MTSRSLLVRTQRSLAWRSRDPSNLQLRVGKVAQNLFVCLGLFWSIDSVRFSSDCIGRRRGKEVRHGGIWWVSACQNFVS